MKRTDSHGDTHYQVRVQRILHRLQNARNLISDRQAIQNVADAYNDICRADTINNREGEVQDVRHLRMDANRRLRYAAERLEKIRPAAAAGLHKAADDIEYEELELADELGEDDLL